MAPKHPRVDTVDAFASEEDEMSDFLALREQVEKMQQEIHTLVDQLMARTYVLEGDIMANNKILAEIYEIVDDLRKK
ncbi:Uncharacterized protein TCM_003394 [Theobroma cacao]|uniref:Uncharacterized protein n=1 Tax=Theobroma cacao TaxID=3641 RepID=A0A061DMW3_THECC|nr:Uncharacterized protein TCM_003394 [Theobroma cacao]